MASANQETPVHSKNIGHENWCSPLVEGTIPFLNSTGPSTGKENAYGKKCIGLDAHSSSCTVAVIDPSGKRLQVQVLETNTRVLIDFIRAIPESRHLCLEEGTHSNRNHEVLSLHVQEIVVAGVRQEKAPKSDKIDAFGLADKLRIGAVETQVYKEQGAFGTMGELCRAYYVLVPPQREQSGSSCQTFRMNSAHRMRLILSNSLSLPIEQSAWRVWRLYPPFDTLRCLRAFEWRP